MYICLNLSGKKDEVIPDTLYYVPFHGDTICVLKSDTTIMNGFVKSIIVAPWCNNICVRSVHVIDKDGNL